MRQTSLLGIVVLLVAGNAAVAYDHAGPKWSYAGDTGPSHWAAESPDFATCGIGKRQSPIDIVAAKKAQLAPIQFSYAAAPLTIIDNGHSIQVNYPPGSFITIDGQRYDLVQFHFHRPSEEQVHGHAYSMVAHLVHKNDRGELAVVAVLLHKGKTNAFLSSVWSHFPADKGKELTVAGTSINIADLVPARHGYYSFEGSLTTPPCSEQVKWFVLKAPAELSAEQVGAFAARYAHNARPVQPLNDRPVLETAD